MRRTRITCSTRGRSRDAPSLHRTTNGPRRSGIADDRRLALGIDRTHSPRACRRGLATLDHPGRAGAAHTTAEADQPGIPGRLDLRAGRVDGDLRRGVQPAGRAGQDADMGLLAAHRHWYRADRLWCVPLADAQATVHTPAWMNKITGASPGRAAAIAVALVVVNPKVLFICAAAGLAIWSAGLGIAGAWITEAFYVLVAASSVAVPVLAYAAAGER